MKSKQVQLKSPTSHGNFTPWYGMFSVSLQSAMALDTNVQICRFVMISV